MQSRRVTHDRVCGAISFMLESITGFSDAQAA